MKKILSVLLATLMLLGTAAVAAQAINVNAIPDEIAVFKGFAKRNADFFSKLDAEDPTLEFSVPVNDQFTIDLQTGKLTFKGGPGTTFSGPVVSIFKDNEKVKDVEVKVQYEWYEYFVIFFAAGYFWIYTINN